MGPVTKERFNVEKYVKDNMLDQYFPPELLQKVLDNKSNINNISFSEGKVALQFTTTTARDNFAKSIDAEYKAKKEYSYGLMFSVDNLTHVYSKLADVSSDISSLSKETSGGIELQVKPELAEVQKSTEAIKENVSQMETLVAEMEKQSVSKEKKSFWKSYLEDIKTLKGALDISKNWEDALDATMKYANKTAKSNKELRQQLKTEKEENRDRLENLATQVSELYSKVEEMEKARQRTGKASKVKEAKKESAKQEQKLSSSTETELKSMVFSFKNQKEKEAFDRILSKNTSISNLVNQVKNPKWTPRFSESVELDPKDDKSLVKSLKPVLKENINYVHQYTFSVKLHFKLKADVIEVRAEKMQ